MRDWVSFLAACVGELLFIGAALAAAGQIRMNNPSWLVPGGLACWLAAWILAMLPKNRPPGIAG